MSYEYYLAMFQDLIYHLAALLGFFVMGYIAFTILLKCLDKINTEILKDIDIWNITT